MPPFPIRQMAVNEKHVYFRAASMAVELSLRGNDTQIFRPGDLIYPNPLQGANTGFLLFQSTKFLASLR